MTEPVLHCEGLRYRYPDGRADALAGVGVRIERGELILLCGGSGSGKTTLLRAACGLVPHFHGGEISGELSVAGLDVREHGPAELAASVGLVAQEPETQVVSTTVRAELELPLELRGHAVGERTRAVEEVALALGIPDLLDRTTDTLSGGELQRVALAAALVTRPALLLLDEPTSQLDPVAGDELIAQLRRLNEEWGVTVLLCEHRLERCLPAADRVLAMDAGAIGFDGEPPAFLAWALARRPELATPGARLFGAAGLKPRGSVREARRALAENGVEPARWPEDEGGDERTPAERGEPALELERLRVELGEGEQRREALRGIDLRISRGERVVLMGHNGAGKSTLLRTAAGLIEPRRGRAAVAAGAALLPQRPGDVLLRERAADELPGEAGKAALELFGLERLADSDPRDLSGGERQRLALAIVAAGRGAGAGEPPGIVMLDEPTRGMDPGRKRELIALMDELAAKGAAVLLATHDVELAAAFADRVVLLGRGEVIADGAAPELLAGGWHFSTEVARILDGRALTPDDGGPRLRAALERDAAAPGAAAARGPGR
jgi:energy-coupling factor transport system ATP-binding protein